MNSDTSDINVLGPKFVPEINLLSENAILGEEGGPTFSFSKGIAEVPLESCFLKVLVNYDEDERGFYPWTAADSQKTKSS